MLTIAAVGLRVMGRGVRGMSVILLVLGVLLAAAGGALIGFGIPIKELSLGATLILAGAFAVVGGLLLVGLSAVVTELARVRAVLKAAPPQASTQPQPQLPAPATRAARVEGPPAETVAREPIKDVVDEPEQPPVPVPAAAVVAAAPAVGVSATAIERLRSAIPRADKPVPETADAVPLSPNGQHAHHAEPPTEVEPVPRSAGAAAVEARGPRLDFLFRPRQARPAPQQQEAFDSMWPKRPAHEGQPDRRLEVARAPAATVVPHPAPAIVAPPAPAAASQERTVAILKSGVVDGMAYTLYADGSIEAQLPQGTVRFGSIAELRAHIENNT